MDERIYTFSYFGETKCFGFIALKETKFSTNHIIVKKWTTNDGRIFGFFRVVYSFEQAKAKTELAQDFETQFRKGPDLYEFREINDNRNDEQDNLLIWFPSYLGGSFEILSINNRKFHMITSKIPDMNEIIETIFKMINIGKADIKEEKDFCNLFNYKI